MPGLGVNVEGSSVGPAEEISYVVIGISVRGLEGISQMGPSGRIFVDLYLNGSVSCDGWCGVVVWYCSRLLVGYASWPTSRDRDGRCKRLWPVGSWCCRPLLACRWRMLRWSGCRSKYRSSSAEQAHCQLTPNTSPSGSLTLAVIGVPTWGWSQRRSTTPSSSTSIHVDLNSNFVIYRAIPVPSRIFAVADPDVEVVGSQHVRRGLMCGHRLIVQWRFRAQLPGVQNQSQRCLAGVVVIV